MFVNKDALALKKSNDWIIKGVPHLAISIPSFFSKYRENDYNCWNIQNNKNMQTNLLGLHKNLTFILRIVSSQQVVSVQMHRELCEETSLLIAYAYPWAKVNHTLHMRIHGKK